MRRLLSVGLLVALAACAERASIDVVLPADRAFVRSDGSLPIEARVDVDRVTRLRIGLDGRRLSEVGRDADGVFRDHLARLPRGRHRLELVAPEIPGMSATRTVFVDRLPDSPIDGLGLSPDGGLALALSDGRPADDGLFVGPLTLTRIGDGPPLHRLLARNGAFGEVAPGEGTVAWVDRWRAGRGRLRVASVDGSDEGATLAGVRGIAYAPDGATLAARGDGIHVAAAPFVDFVEAAASADLFAFVGPEDDLVAFAKTDVEGAYRATMASAPGYAPTALLPVLRASIARRGGAREVALRHFDAEGPGGLSLYDFGSRSLDERFTAVSTVAYSGDGAWMLAIADPDAAGIGRLVLEDRSTGAEVEVADGIVDAAFEPEGGRVLALSSSGGLTEIDLTGTPFGVEALADGVVAFAALEGGARLWQTADGSLFARLLDAAPGGPAVVPLGPVREDAPEVVASSDARTIAFASEDGTRRPVRRVDLALGMIADFGVDARGPILLASGAVAWIERREEAIDDLWVFPAFPISIRGPRRLAERIDAGAIAIRSDSAAIAVVSDDGGGGLVRCVDPWMRERSLGPFEAAAPRPFFHADGRIVWWGRDGRERRVLFLERCFPDAGDR